MFGLIFQPAGDVIRKTGVGEGFLNDSFELGGNGKAIDLTGFLFGVAGQGFALDEAALNGEEGSEFGVPGLQAAEFRLDPEELADEIFEIGSDFDEELRMLLRGKRSGVVACSGETLMERWNGGMELLEEQAVELEEPFPLIQIAESKSKRQCKRRRKRGGVLLF